MNVSELNLKKVINASGRMSILGVSRISDDVAQAMRTGGQHYYEMAQLHEASGRFISQYTETESAMVTNSASAAIALSVAGLVAGDDTFMVEHLHDDTCKVHKDILIMTGHLVDYGAPVSTMIQLGGGRVRTVGHANGCTLRQIEAAITENTAGMLFVQSHHCVQKNMPDLADVGALLTEHRIPLIVDAAAETDLAAFSKVADMVIFSGSKALEGPTSGILAGMRQYIELVRLHERGIGRAMKIGKEAIFGLLTALENYEQTGLSKAEQLQILGELDLLNNITGVTVTRTEDASRPEIVRGRITIDATRASHPASQVVRQLKQGDIAIYTRDYHADTGHFDVDVRSLTRDNARLIANEIKRIMED